MLPKFNLLQAYNTGKIAGKEIMILQLNQIALNYPKTEEGQKANEILNYLKSDLTSEGKDNDNPIQEIEKTPEIPVEPTPPAPSSAWEGTPSTQKVQRPNNQKPRNPTPPNNNGLPPRPRN